MEPSPILTHGLLGVCSVARIEQGRAVWPLVQSAFLVCPYPSATRWKRHMVHNFHGFTMLYTTKVPLSIQVHKFTTVYKRLEDLRFCIFTWKEDFFFIYNKDNSKNTTCGDILQRLKCNDISKRIVECQSFSSWEQKRREKTLSTHASTHNQFLFDHKLPQGWVEFPAWKVLCKVHCTV